MKNKLFLNRTSYWVLWPLIIVVFISCILAFIFKVYFLSLVLLILFVIFFFAHIWAVKAMKKLEFKLTADRTGVFPGEKFRFRIYIRNGKFMPVMDPEIYFPLSKNLYCIPDKVRKVEEYEKMYLDSFNASLEKVGEMTLPALLWYEARTVESEWTAEKRGIYSTKNWKIRTGDGFGLSQTEQSVRKEDIRLIAVYPKVVPVNTSEFMRNTWNSNTGARGIVEDNTVIRSSRNYMNGDPVRNINWRLTARGLPLSVNIYEEILPQAVYFIFDGESFSGTDKHNEEMEDALSITSSIMLGIYSKINCGISFPEGRHPASDGPVGTDIEDLLRLFSQYLPLPDKEDEEGKVVNRKSKFNLHSVLEETEKAGHFYYIVYSTENIPGLELFKYLEPEKTTILTYKQSKQYLNYRTLTLTDFKAVNRINESNAHSALEEMEEAGHFYGKEDRDGKQA